MRKKQDLHKTLAMALASLVPAPLTRQEMQADETICQKCGKEYSRIWGHICDKQSKENKNGS